MTHHPFRSERRADDNAQRVDRSRSGWTVLLRPRGRHHGFLGVLGRQQVAVAEREAGQQPRHARIHQLPTAGGGRPAAASTAAALQMRNPDQAMVERPVRVPTPSGIAAPNRSWVLPGGCASKGFPAQRSKFTYIVFVTWPLFWSSSDESIHSANPRTKGR